jgi:hypothetical protein
MIQSYCKTGLWVLTKNYKFKNKEYLSNFEDNENKSSLVLPFLVIL